MLSRCSPLYKHTYNVWSKFTVSNGKRSEHPRGMPLVTRMQELQPEEQRRETQCHPSRANFCRKTRTAHRAILCTSSALCVMAVVLRRFYSIAYLNVKVEVRVRVKVRVLFYCLPKRFRVRVRVRVLFYCLPKREGRGSG
jgi:hypothetical protein